MVWCLAWVLAGWTNLPAEPLPPERPNLPGRGSLAERQPSRDAAAAARLVIKNKAGMIRLRRCSRLIGGTG